MELIKDKEYTMNLCLTEYIGAEIMEIEDSNGYPVKGIFIPFDLNFFYVSTLKNNVWTSLNLRRIPYARFPLTHRVTPNWPPEHVEKLRKLGYLERNYHFGKAYILNNNSNPLMNTKHPHEYY